MNKKSFFAASLFAMISATAFANTPSNPIAPPQDHATPCRKEFGFYFYPKTVVEQVLPKYKIDPAKIKSIVKGLEADDLKVNDTVWARAQKMTPNPFLDEDKADDQKLYRDVVTEFFSNTLKQNGIQDQKLINTIFDDVQLLRTEKLAACEGYGRNAKPPRGFMPIVRTLTTQEMVYEFPEAFNPALRKQIIDQGKQQQKP